MLVYVDPFTCSSAHPTVISLPVCMDQVLGISPNSDSEAVSRAYKTKLRDAGKDEGRKQRVESAHSSIMMASLTSRLKVIAAIIVLSGHCA